MKKILYGLVFAASIAGWGYVAHAHHSLSAYDITKTIDLDGTIREFQWTSPHCWLVVTVMNSNGVASDWILEAGTPVVNNQYGWKRDLFKPGEKIRATIFPVRDGTAHGALMRVTMADGRVVDGPLATYLKNIPNKK